MIGFNSCLFSNMLAHTYQSHTMHNPCQKAMSYWHIKELINVLCVNHLTLLVFVHIELRLLELKDPSVHCAPTATSENA